MTSDQLARYHEQTIRELRSENTTLRKKLGEAGRHAHRVQQAYIDALLMAEWRSVAIQPSRRYAAYHNISQRRWQNAVALLRLARVLDGRRWATSDLTTIEQRLEVAKLRAINAPEAFKARLIRHGTR